MKTLLSAAAVAAVLTCGSLAAQAAPSDGRIHVAQMNSPGDGLDGRRAVREGNARPYRLDSMGGRGMNRYRRYRRYR